MVFADNARCLVVDRSGSGIWKQDLLFSLQSTRTDIKFDGQKHRCTFPNGATVPARPVERNPDFAKYQESRSLISPLMKQDSMQTLIDRLKILLRARKRSPDALFYRRQSGWCGSFMVGQTIRLKKPEDRSSVLPPGFQLLELRAPTETISLLTESATKEPLCLPAQQIPELGRAWLGRLVNYSRRLFSQM